MYFFQNILISLVALKYLEVKGIAKLKIKVKTLLFH